MADSGLATSQVLDRSFPAAQLIDRQQPPTSDAYVATALRMLKLCPTKYNVLFFSKLNIDTLQRAFRDRVRAKLGYVIDRQDDNALCVIMRGVFTTWGREPPCDRQDVVEAHVALLNGVVMKLALPQIASGVVAYVNYLRDADSLPVPPPLPSATSTAGTKNLPIFSGI